ncbi:glycosyltransferase family 2 protein [Streptomyces violaceusniger]
MNAPGPAVGVVVATRDRAERLATTLEHLTALPERPPVVVVDNGSADRTRAMIAERYPHVRVLAQGDDHGALARNDGVRAIVLVTDSGPGTRAADQRDTGGEAAYLVAKRRTP